MNALKATQTGLVRALLDIQTTANPLSQPSRYDFAAYMSRDHAVEALKEYLASGEIKAESDPDIVLRGLWWITLGSRQP